MQLFVAFPNKALPRRVFIVLLKRPGNANHLGRFPHFPPSGSPNCRPRVGDGGDGERGEEGGRTGGGGSGVGRGTA